MHNRTNRLIKVELIEALGLCGERCYQISAIGLEAQHFTAGSQRFLGDDPAGFIQHARGVPFVFIA